MLPPPPQAFILKLSEEVRWTFGSVQRVKYPVQELLLGDHKNDTAAALHLVCKNVRYGPSLLCPEGSLEFVSGSFSKYIGMFDFVRSIIEESKKPSTDGADLPEEMIFRLPNKPGVEPPPVESIIMLLIAERAWQRFGRNMLFIEMFFYVAYLSLLSFVSMDRISDEPLLVINPCAPEIHRRSDSLTGEREWRNVTIDANPPATHRILKLLSLCTPASAGASGMSWTRCCSSWPSSCSCCRR